MGQEQVGAIMLAAGLVCLSIAALWILIAAWKVSWHWGLAVLLFAPLALLFVAKHFPRVKMPIWLAVIGAVLIGVPYTINALRPIDRGMRDAKVEGETHLTLNGWDQTDYSILRDKADVVVLQMANPDVTDATLEYLRGMQKLEELDLNNTQVTDKGLAILKQLPALAKLRLKATKITDAGFQSELGGKETLIEVDLRETQVSSKTAREWKKAREGRNALR